MRAIILIFLGAFLVSCSSDPQEMQQKTTVCQVVENGLNIRIKTISSSRFSWSDQEKDVVVELLRFVNSGQYNVTEVKTSYIKEYLVKAVVIYSLDESCDNKPLRMKVIRSAKFNWQDQEREVTNKLDSIVNSGIYDIKAVNTITVRDYLVAAEVYYYE